MPKKALKLRELTKKLKPYGVVVLKKRGKGSERILLQPDAPGSKKGPQYPIKDHGEGTEISIPVINAILRRFDINNFWD
jgi:hypothetical protein